MQRERKPCEWRHSLTSVDIPNELWHTPMGIAQEIMRTRLRVLTSRLSRRCRRAHLDGTSTKNWMLTWPCTAKKTAVAAWKLRRRCDAGGLVARGVRILESARHDGHLRLRLPHRRSTSNAAEKF